MLSLLLTLAAAQLGPCGPGGPLFCGGEGFAFFEFAPTSGRGMGAACACTTPTGAKGEAMTFTRASSGTCLKGGTTSGIVNGDMVTCSSDQPRVMRGGDGTGGLGLLREESRQNNALRSEEIDNAYWQKINLGAVAPTVTADATTAPDGTTTAERVQFPSTTLVGGQYSIVYRSDSCPANGASASLWLRGNSTSGSVYVGIDDGASWQTVLCTYVSDSWTLCGKDNVSRVTATGMFLGNSSSIVGTDLPAHDIFVWGMQCELGPYGTSYIKTEGSAVTRASDSATFQYVAAGPTFSMSATWDAPATIASNVALHLFSAGTVGTILSIAATKVRGSWLNGGTVTQDSAGSVTANVFNAMGLYYDGTNKAACLSGVCTSAAAAITLPEATQTLYIGGDPIGANAANGVVKKVCLDPSPSRCR